MANIKKELNQIKNAVYGREVRGSIHDGIDKMNREVESSTEKAGEAHEVMESIMREGFDNAALEANFEEKLDKEINNLQPEWTGFKDDITSKVVKNDNFLSRNGVVNRKTPRPMITWIDDDGKLGVYTKLYPIFKERGIPMTPAIIPDRVGTSGYVTVENIKEMIANGMEIVSHTNEHDPDDRPINMDKERLREGYRSAKEKIIEWGGNPRCIVYPFGNHNDTIESVAREFHDYAFYISGLADNTEPPINMYKIPRFGIPGKSTEQIKNAIDTAYDKNEWIILFGHIDGENWYTKSFVEEIVDYATNKGMEWVTTIKGVEYHGNLMDLDKNNNIDKFGKPHSQFLGVTNLPNFDEFINSTPQSNYRTGITISGVRYGNRLGLPNNRPGVVITVKPDNSEQKWTKQYFYEYDGEITGERYAVSETEWSEWKITNIGFYGLDKFTAESKPSEFPLGLSINGVRSASAVNSPYSMPGVIETLKPHGSEYGWARQTFKAHSDNFIASRFGNASEDSWGRWEVVGEYIAIREKFNGNNKPSDFIVGTTMNRIRSGRGVDIPTNNGCVLKTTKYDDTEVVFTVQEVRELFGNKVFTRTASSESGWNNWKELATV